MSINRGDVCDNGAVVVDYKKAWDDSGYVILCLWINDTQSQPHTRTADPYVTWFARREDEKIRCFTGHYHDQLSDAVVDFTSRI
jgi:hypothetical protein